MLVELAVKNLAVVENLEVSFTAGMSTITGETGAGKSILLNSLNLALGQRADKSMVRSGSDKADISATFLLNNNSRVKDILLEQELEADDECILRRVITADGRSKAFINGVPMPLNIVRALGEGLVDMHGQNEHQLLLKPLEQLSLLDNFAESTVLVQEINVVVKEYKKLNLQVQEASNNQDLFLEKQELYQHQLDELENANLTIDELNSIEDEYKVSSNSKDLVVQVSNILNQLEGDIGLNPQLSSLSYELEKTQTIDAKLSSANEMLSNAQLQVQECVYELNGYLNNLNIDEEYLQNLELRISELHDLSRKHNCQIIELLSVKQDITDKLNKLSIGSESIEKLKEKLNKLDEKYQSLANKLTKIRTSKAKELSTKVSEVMQISGMPGSEFSIDICTKDSEVYLNGNESVEFLVRTNMGQEHKALKKVASGGELSRISLAISVVASNSEYTPTIIFDEVDVGISGAVAQVVGQKLKSLSDTYQVLCITHLAQVASFGDQHLKVIKSQGKNGASTTIENLSSIDRVQEVARILSGEKITDRSINAAEELIASSV